MKFADGDPITAAKHEMQAKGYITIKTPSFVQKLQKITDKRPGKKHFKKLQCVSAPSK